MAIKSDNIQEAILSNMPTIAASVQNFQQMSESSGANDIALNYANTKENYEN